MAGKRPAKFFKLNFSSLGSGAMISIMSNPDEARISGSLRSFISIKEDGITIAPGRPNKIMMQALPGSIKYAGMVQDVPFPLGLIPIGFIPKQIFNPPLAELLPIIRDVSIISSSFVGV